MQRGQATSEVAWANLACSTWAAAWAMQKGDEAAEACSRKKENWSRLRAGERETGLVGCCVLGAGLGEV